MSQSPKQHYSLVCFHGDIYRGNKMCYETQMPPYEANSRGGHQCLNPKSRCQNLRFQHKGLVTRNMKCKSPITYHSKDMANVEKILESGSNFKVKVTKSKVMVPLESSCHKEYKYEI